MTSFYDHEPPIPYYVDTDRQVAVGDRGACPVPLGQPGLVVALLAFHDDDGRITGWSATLRYPNHVRESCMAHELHWVDPEHCVEVYLSEGDYEAVRGVADSPDSIDWVNGDLDELPDIDAGVLNRIIDAVRHAELRATRS